MIRALSWPSLLMVVVWAAAASSAGRITQVQSGQAQPGDSSKPGAAREGRARLLRAGERVYDSDCAECHGWYGDGDGHIAGFMRPRPRNFLMGKFKITTTENLVPSDEDLIRTIQRGLPGTDMPAWDGMEEKDIEAVVAFIRDLQARAMRKQLKGEVDAGSLSAEDAEAILAERTVPGPGLIIPPEPEFDESGRARGREIYEKACAACHGVDGVPLREAITRDDEGNRVLPTSFAQAVFKGGGEGAAIYARVAKGMNGTAMPAYDEEYGGHELWDVVHYVQSLARPQPPAPARQRRLPGRRFPRSRE